MKTLSVETLYRLIEEYSFVIYDNEYYNNPHAFATLKDITDCKNIDYVLENAKLITIGFEQHGNRMYSGKQIKILKKKEVTFDYILEKVNFTQEYKNLCDRFNKLIENENISAYPTTYGIGVFRLMGWETFAIDSIKKY